MVFAVIMPKNIINMLNFIIKSYVFHQTGLIDILTGTEIEGSHWSQNIFGMPVAGRFSSD